MRVLVGTSGYSFPEWRGSFYPEKLKTGEMLRWYAERLDTVEINNTFYRMPSEAMLLSWAADVPERFRFALKAPQRLTHILRLKEEAAEPLGHFLRTASALGSRLGPLLFQLPPNFKKDVPRLDAFLAHLPLGGEPGAMRAAFEFRHASWFEDEVYGTLRARGAALCLAEDDGLATPFVPTAGFGYVRLRRSEYTSDEIAAKAAAISRAPWEDAYVFFKHEEEGKGPFLAAALRAALGAATS